MGWEDSAARHRALGVASSARETAQEKRKRDYKATSAITRLTGGRTIVF
jgi:hypothetical protein